MTLYRDEKLQHEIEEQARSYAARRAQEHAERPRELQDHRDWLIAFYGENKDLVAHVIPPLFFQGYLRAHPDDWCKLNDLELLFNAIRTHTFLRRLYEKYQPVIGDAYSPAHFEERIAQVVGLEEYTKGAYHGPREPGLGRGGSALEKELNDLYERLTAAAEAKKTEESAEPKPSADIEAQIREINASDYSEDLKAVQLAHLKNKELEAAS